MNHLVQRKAALCFLLLLMIVFCGSVCAAKAQEKSDPHEDASSQTDTSRFLVAIEDEPDTVDFQCTSIYYTVAQNVFNRLVETGNDANGLMEIQPSLASSWEVSEDGRTYTFHLRENVTFSNGSPLTASDVKYTFVRLLTHPESCNRDIADQIVGAQALESGKAEDLEGLKVLGDLDFSITLEQPFEAFLACLSMPGASILDEETTRQAGDRFGKTPEKAPRCEGLDLRFITDSREIRRMFENGEIDVLDLDEVGNAAEFFLHGDLYQDRLFHCQRIGITYIALNETIEPLNDVRVRKAMQLSLDRALLLAAVYGGRGTVENGIYPHGLYGFNPSLPGIPYDPETAQRLLEEAGYPDGFDLTVSVNSSSTRWELAVLRLAASMWGKIGIRAKIDVTRESEFMRLRKNGRLACYTALWTADYNDPDNFLYTFYGDRENTVFRSLCYSREDIMERVRLARTIVDPDERIREYQDLERIIVQEDAAWIPLYSRLRYYVTSERLEGIQASWNGSVKNMYREMSITAEE